MYVPSGEITVPIKPITKCAPRTVARITNLPAVRKGLKPNMFYSTYYEDGPYKTFRDLAPQAIAEAAKDVDTIWEPLDLVLTITSEKPASTTLPFPKGDVDNFSKSILDACTTAKFWVDDWQVRQLTLIKTWGDSHSFTLKWDIIPDLADKWPVFSKHRVAWEMAQDE